MVKLKTLLAQELTEWPKGAKEIGQWPGGEVCVRDPIGVSARELFTSITIADDVDAWVTRAQWQAERDRIAVNQQATNEAREIAAGNGTFYESVDAMCAELAELATGQKKPPYAFTEADIRAAFEAGANWMRGAVEAGAVEYVDKLKGLK